jgi:ParB family transcriptional regulator, chromosome partitioning protein
MIRTIPLSNLIPSPRNVRRTSDEQADLQLKADIEARGLLQNLVVAPAKKPKGRFTVEAGGRRFAALVSLAEEGKLQADHEVCCLVVQGDPAAAQEAGLAENLLKQCLPEALEVASAHRFLWRHVGTHASICFRSGGFLRRVVEDLEARRRARLISLPWRRKMILSFGSAA